MFSLVRVPWLAYPILFVTGFSMIVTNALANSMLQSFVDRRVPWPTDVGLFAHLGRAVAGASARSRRARSPARSGVDWAIGGGAAIMLGFAMYAFRAAQQLDRGGTLTANRRTDRVSRRR